jgi:hypothetical protein
MGLVGHTTAFSPGHSQETDRLLRLLGIALFSGNDEEAPQLNGKSGIPSLSQLKDLPLNV